MPTQPKVSVVIPTIEEQAVFRIIKDIRNLLGKDTEIIIVDKSSEAYYRRLVNEGVTVIRQKDRGVERAIMHGLLAAHGKILANIDGDGTHDVHALLDAVKMIETDKADLVLGNRLDSLEKGSMTLYIKTGNKMLSWLFSRMHHVKVHDILVGLFAMRRSAFDEVKNIEPYRAGNVTTYAIEFADRGYRISEVPVKYYKRSEGKSKLSRYKFSYALQAGANIIRLARDYSPLLVFGLIGMILLISGFVLGAFVLWNFLHTGLFNEVGRALLAFMLVVLGLLSIFVGVILDLLLEIERKLNR